MQFPLRNLLVCGLVAGCAWSAAAAPPTWVPAFEAKIHAGYAPNQGDNLNAGTLAYGVNLAWAAPRGTFGVELGYHYKTGDLFAGTIRSEVAAGKQAVDFRNSVEQKRNDLKGFYLRFAYEGGFELPLGMVPRAGLMIGGTMFRQEYVGDVRSLSWTATTANAWRDTFHGTPTKGGLTTSPFLGVSVPVNPGSSLEIQLLWLNYKAIDYVHMPGGGSTYELLKDVNGKPVGPLAPHNAFPGDTLAARTRFTPHVELGWTFRF